MRKPPDPPDPPADEPLWTIAQVSTYLHVPISTLHKWRSRDYGPPAHRLGGALRYEPAAVRSFADWETPS